jgi:hypothetical protein
VQVADPEVRVYRTEIDVQLSGRMSRVDKYRQARVVAGGDDLRDRKDEAGRRRDLVDNDQFRPRCDGSKDAADDVVGSRHVQRYRRLDHPDAALREHTDLRGHRGVPVVGRHHLVAGGQGKAGKNGRGAGCRVGNEDEVVGITSQERRDACPHPVDEVDPPPHEHIGRVGLDLGPECSRGVGHRSGEGAEPAVVEVGDPGVDEPTRLRQGARHVGNVSGRRAA